MGIDYVAWMFWICVVFFVRARARCVGDSVAYNEHLQHLEGETSGNPKELYAEGV